MARPAGAPCVGPWVRDHLLMFDLGYFRYQLFACIGRNGGHFLPLLRRLDRVLLREAVDPNAARHGLLASVELRTPRLHPMAAAA